MTGLMLLLIVASAALMLASSGIDGAYMARWMPSGWGWLGFALNTTADLTGETLMYAFGRLQQERRGSKRQRASWAILGAEVVTVLFSWFFSWRQLRAVLPAVEPQAWNWVSAVSAAFVPLLLAFCGYAQAVLAGRFGESERQSDPGPQNVQESVEAAPANSHICAGCGRAFGSRNALSAHMRFCERREQ